MTPTTKALVGTPFPDKIYLQTGSDEAGMPSTDEDVTWCRDKIEGHDELYIRATLAGELAEALEVSRNELWRLLGVTSKTIRQTDRVLTAYRDAVKEQEGK